MSLENTESPAISDSPHNDVVGTRPRKQSAEISIARNRRKAIAIDGLMFESGSTQDESFATSLDIQSELDYAANNAHIAAEGLDGAPHDGLETASQLENDVLETAASSNDRAAENTDPDDSPQKTQPTPLSPASSTSSASSSAATSPGTPPESPPAIINTSFPPREQRSSDSSTASAQQSDLAPSSIGRSVSLSKRESMFLGDHITISQDDPFIIESPSSHLPGSNDDQEDMKEVEIETTDPSHLFWVPFHLHPEIAPNEYNQWLSKHGVDNEAADGMLSTRSTSITRRKSVLSAQYNPEEDHEDQPTKPANIVEEAGTEPEDFLSGVFSAPLEQMGEPPLKTKTSLRRSVSLSASSPTKDHFPIDAIEEDLLTVKRPGGLERGGLSLLRRSARTKIRRNSTASNDTRTDVSRLRQTVNADGEYPAVSLVDLGPQPLPSTVQSSAVEQDTSEDDNKSRRDGEAQPLKRFVSTLRDSSKPTITTYVEPHLLEQQRRDNEEVNRDKDGVPSFRISAPGKLENSTAARVLIETMENDRKEKPENFTISYPIPPPVKLAQNLLQQPSSQHPLPSQQPSSSQSLSKQKYPGQTGTHGTQTHAKKPSTWSWLWGKEKGGEKPSDPSVHEPGVTSTSSTGNDTNTQSSSSSETTVKKQSTLSLLFSRNAKATSSKAHATTAENTQSITINGFSGQGALSEKPKYSNYNRLPIHVERAIYRLSHVKLANPRRPLHEQVLISNMMFWYLGVIQQQQLLQQQAELQLQQQQQTHQQKESSKGDDSKENGKKPKPKKRKSQKKKNQQRNASKSAERIVKGPEFEIQQQQQQQQYRENQYVSQGARSRQQGGASPASGNPLAVNQGRTQSSHHTEPDEEYRIGGGGQEYPDSNDDSEGDGPVLQQQRLEIGSQSDIPTILSTKSVPQSAQDDEDDDVPLAHYQNITRQTVPVSS